MFDITQTNGKPLPSKTVLHNGAPEMEKAVKAVIGYCPVDIKVLDASQLSVPAYSPANQVIYCPEGLDDVQVFAGLIKETVQARVHNGGKYEGYSREDCELDAASVSYMVCRRYGIEADRPDPGDLAALYDGYEPSERRAALDSLQKMSEQIGDRVEREINPPERTLENSTRNNPELQER